MLCAAIVHEIKVPRSFSPPNATPMPTPSANECTVMTPRIRSALRAEAPRRAPTTYTLTINICKKTKNKKNGPRTSRILKEQQLAKGGETNSQKRAVRTAHQLVALCQHSIDDTLLVAHADATTNKAKIK